MKRMEKVVEGAKNAMNSVATWIDDHDREAIGFMTAFQYMWPWTLIGITFVAVVNSKHPARFLNKELVKKIVDEAKEEG